MENILSRLPENPKILVIRKDNIGDLVCTTPLIAALRQRFPQAFIGALVNSYNAPVLRGNPDLNAVHFYTKAKHRGPNRSVLSVYWDRLCLMWQLRKFKYDLAILANCSFVPTSLGLARQVGPRFILGFVEGKLPNKEKHISVPVPYNPDEPGHETERLSKLLQPLGISGPMPAAKLVPDPLRVAHVRRDLGPVLGDQVPVAIHISARKVHQRWPAECFVELMARLHRELGKSFMLFWSPGDENNPFHPGDDGKAKAILAALPGVPVYPCPTHALEELVAGLSCCGCMICSDGGAMHIGAGLGLPIVCFFGNSDPVKWHPWQVPYELLQKDTRKVTDITVDEAYAAFMRLQRS